MRPTEDAVMEDQLGLTDVWKLSGSSKATKWTWDTTKHSEDGTWNRYYGSTTREYKARYDRIYYYCYYASHHDELSCRSGGGGGASLARGPSYASFQLIANRPLLLERPNHFLSDHFGVVTDLHLPTLE